MKLKKKTTEKEFNHNCPSAVYNKGKWSNFFNDPERLSGEIIDNVDDLEALCEKMKDIPMFAFDTETNTLRVLADNKDFRCADIQISWGENDNYDIILGHIREEDLDRNIPLDEAIPLLKPIFEREDVTLIGANIKYDMHVLKRLGIEIKTRSVFDVNLASWLVDENTLNGLKENSAEKMNVSQTHFNEATDTIPNEVKKAFGYAANAKVKDFGLVSIEEGAKYALDDPFYTWCLAWGYFQELEDIGMSSIYYKRMIPFLFVLFDMEEQGVCVDLEKLEELSVNIKEDIDDLTYKIYELAGVEFNISSNAQKSLLLYGIDDYSMDYPEFEKKKLKNVAKEYQRYLVKHPNEMSKQEFIDDKKKKARKTYEDKQNDEDRVRILKKTFKFRPPAYTESGAPATDSDAIWRLSRQEFKNGTRKAEGAEMCSLLNDYSKLAKLNTAFIEGLKEQLYDDNKVHPNYNQCGTDSGRLSCIAEDTLIRLCGEYKAIQDVKVGDLVYCYDNEGDLHLRKVLNVVDKGFKKCIKVNWVSQGRRELGSLICTPNHKIRLADGTWVKARDLVEKDRLTHLRVSSCDRRPRLYMTGGKCEQEQVFIKNEVFNEYDKNIVIHHKDEDPVNNRLDNLVLMTRSEHTSYHTKELYSQGRISWEHLLYAKRNPVKGEDHPYYKKFTKEELEQMVHDAKGRIREIPLDFNTFKKKCKEVGFDYRKVAGEYQTQYRDVTDEEFIKVYYECDGVPYAIHRKLNIGRTKVANTIKRLDLCNNHKVLNIEPCGVKHVYDLEVEEFHNFIASEICVHNCSAPNLQQLPKAEDDAKYQIRSLFIGSEYLKMFDNTLFDSLEDAEKEGYDEFDIEEIKRKKIIAIDYHNLEMVCLTHFSHDKNLSEMFANDDDAHGSTAVNMFSLDCTPVECKKKYPHLRQAAKTINFLLMYGGGAGLLYENLKSDHASPLDLGDKQYLEQYHVKTGKDVAQAFIDKYFESYSGVAKFIREQKKFAHRNGYVQTITGRKRRLHNINSSDGEKRSYEERLAVNSAIQGTAGDITSSAQLRLFKEGLNKKYLCNMLIQIHDELVWECPEEYLDDCIPIIKYDMEHPFGDKENQQVQYLRADYDYGNSYQEAK